jgi:hypothetical protein
LLINSGGQTYVRITELDSFVEYVRKGAIISSITSNSVTAEGRQSTRTFEPEEGLTEEVYQRLASDDLLFETLESLAWCVIRNVLLKRGLTEVQIRQAQRLVPEGTITDLVEANSFEVVSHALEAKVRSATRKRR